MRKLTSKIDTMLIAAKNKAVNGLTSMRASNDHIVSTIALIIVAVVLVGLIFGWAKSTWNTTAGTLDNNINDLFNKTTV